MDSVDRAILAELQADGRLTVTELADRVRLTPGPCHRRLRELERSGVITGYRALVDPAAVGMGFEALVQVTLERGDAATVTAFEAAVAGLPQVRHAERLFGDPDYLLRVAARDLGSFADLRDRKLATLPGIHRLTSTIVMKRIVDNRPLPLTTRDRGAGRGVSAETPLYSAWIQLARSSRLTDSSRAGWSVAMCPLIIPTTWSSLSPRATYPHSHRISFTWRLLSGPAAQRNARILA
jgi:DNA-binding Lrp family transcriptional regulator